MKDMLVNALLAFVLFWSPHRVGQTTLDAGDLGGVKIFKKSGDETKKYVILISEKSGWNSSYEELANTIAEDKNVVIGIDLGKYTKQKKLENNELSNIARNIEKIGKSVQQLFAEKTFKQSTVIIFKDTIGLTAFLGTRSSAEIFESVNSIQGCFDPKKVKLLNANHVNKPVKIYLDEKDACPELSNWALGEGISVQKVTELANNPVKSKFWSAEMKNMWRNNLRAPTSQGSKVDLSNDSIIQDLPLIINEPSAITSNQFVILYSGDGGWAEFTQELAAEYQKRGVPVVGVNSLFNFWSPKNPSKAAADLEQISTYFSKKWNLKKYDLVGFSFGAEVLPSLVNAVSENNKKMIEQVIMIAPGKNVKFEFKINDWLQNLDTGIPIKDEILKIKEFKIKCIYADSDRSGICSEFPWPGKAFKLQGDHHFDSNFLQFSGLLWSK